MTYVAVKDLKQGKRLWKTLNAERELVVTRDGRPRAILVGVTPDTVEDSLAAIRRSMFSAAVGRVRQRASSRLPAPGVVEDAIRQSRHSRRVR